MIRHNLFFLGTLWSGCSLGGQAILYGFMCFFSFIVLFFPLWTVLLLRQTSPRSTLLSQMTFVRLLDTLPFIYERLSLSASKISGSFVPVVSGLFDFKWLSYLVDFGKSSLLIITRRWKQCMLALMNLFKGSCGGSTLCTISVIEAIISCGQCCPS